MRLCIIGLSQRAAVCLESGPSAGDQASQEPVHGDVFAEFAALAALAAFGLSVALGECGQLQSLRLLHLAR